MSSQDDGCTVVRSFHNGQAIQVGFQTTMQTRPAILLVSSPKTMLPTGIGELPLTLDASETVMVHYGSFETSQPGIRLLKLFPDNATMARLATAVQVRIGDKLPTLRITGIDAAIKSINKCTAEKISSWGVDPDLYFQGKTSGITGNFATLF